MKVDPTRKAPPFIFYMWAELIGSNLDRTLDTVCAARNIAVLGVRKSTMPSGRVCCVYILHDGVMHGILILDVIRRLVHQSISVIEKTF